MPRPKDPTDNPKPDHVPDERREPGKDHPRPRRHRAGRDRIVHAAITERRFTGGPPPTHEAYGIALEQWNRLPGSIVRPATDIRLTAELPPAESQDANAEFPSGVAPNEVKKP